MDLKDQPPVTPWIVAASVMRATFMEILDTSVVNVSIPHIAGNLAATIDEGTWVVTSYLVSNVIILSSTTRRRLFRTRRKNSRRRSSISYRWSHPESPQIPPVMAGCH